VASQEFFPRAEYGTFLVFDPEHWPDEAPDSGPGLKALQGGVAVGTTASDFYPSVTLTTDPFTPEADWTPAGSAPVSVRSGSLVIRSVMQDPAGTFALPPGDYEVAAYSRGGQDALLRTQEELFFRGVEEWVLAFAPKRG
jgi:hypothetical protein